MYIIFPCIESGGGEPYQTDLVSVWGTQTRWTWHQVKILYYLDSQHGNRPWILKACVVLEVFSHKHSSLQGTTIRSQTPITNKRRTIFWVRFRCNDGGWIYKYTYIYTNLITSCGAVRMEQYYPELSWPPFIFSPVRKLLTVHLQKLMNKRRNEWKYE